MAKWQTLAYFMLSYPFVLQSSLPNFKQNEFSVVRQHEEFIWLHDSFVENEDYAGYIVSVFLWRIDKQSVCLHFLLKAGTYLP